ncbi:uncharacterized protein [Nicotiana sylvestris]|uniref:Uncharacterized protein LOC104224134 n=1 Tax=Nicotiana sylvestris TaxID=4096 RepID=A0A1U7W1U7_NICSY|nr:PREDICTED: uncharacterized protein LOC104224134 [Nicotiana sylvestris]
MDPLASHPTAFPDFQQNYLDSNRSSSCSSLNNTRDGPLPPVPGAKLRLMCSYGGHIIPRPHDKSLFYIGGDTRIVVVDRLSSLSDIHTRLSHTLLNGNKFTLKYQLPNEDLDSIVSVTTEEDLQHMIEAYDRAMLVSPNLRPSRLRLFLFLEKIETAASMSSLLADAKSETWFVDAFNNAGFISRGLSDSAVVDNLLELDNFPESDSFADLEARNHESLAKNAIQEVHSTMPDSPMVDTTSSFESTVSSQSRGNLLPVAVKVEDSHMNATFKDQILGLYERFSHINIASNEQKLDDGFNHLAATATAAAAPALPTVIGGAETMLSAGFVKSTAANDDEKTDQGAPTRLRKLLLRSLSNQRKNGDGYTLPSPDSQCAGYNLPSPDSVASDSNIASATSLAKHTIYQEATPATGVENSLHIAVTDSRKYSNDTNSQSQMQQVQDSVVIQASQHNLYQQPQFIPTGAHYIQHTATGPITIPSYCPMYALQSQHPIHQQMDQQYQMYLIPVPQMTMQSNIADATVTSFKPEMAANAYRIATTATPSFVQVPNSQFQQQYCCLSKFSPPSQPLAAVSNANANLSYEYSHPTHDQVYYA